MPTIESFEKKLARVQDEAGTLLCVGSDPDPNRMPPSVRRGKHVADAVREFCITIIEATAPWACAFKVNFGFFEALGDEGWRVLSDVAAAIPESKISIADAKRGDIGNTGRFYAQAVFEKLPFDACTVTPYMGRSSVEPFLAYAGKAAFVLARTSNPDSDEFQLSPSGRDHLYRHVAMSALDWARESPGSLGLVVGATDIEAMRRLRDDCPATPFLIPGVGAQGGRLEDVLQAGLTAEGAVIISASRSILYSSGGEDFREAAGDAARTLTHTIAAIQSDS